MSQSKQNKEEKKGAHQKHDSARPNTICALPDDVLRHCFSFVGSGQYRYVACTCHHFQDIYEDKHEKKTMCKTAAWSLSRTQLYLEDMRDRGWRNECWALDKITLEAAEKGQVDTLVLARKRGCVIDRSHFYGALRHGHVCVLKWLDSKGLAPYNDSDDSQAILCAVCENGKVEVLEWVVQRGHAVDTLFACQRAAFWGQVAMLRWLNEQDLLCVESRVWTAAAYNGHVSVLAWLYNEGYDPDPSLLPTTVHNDRRDVILWCRDHDIDCDIRACAYAAMFGNLPLLQWLRDNDFAWNSRVLGYARGQGHEHVATWAAENGCPNK